MNGASTATSHQKDPGALLDPFTSIQFFRDFWQRRPFIDRAVDPQRFAAVADFDAVDSLIASAAGSAQTKLHIIRSGRAIPVSSGNDDGEGDISRAYKAYESGQSLLLTQVHNQSQRIRELCRAMEIRMVAHGVALSRAVGANLYLAPQRAQGLALHYDSHDTFVLQIDGEKHWKLYDPLDSFPVKRDVGPPPAEDNLKLREDTLLRQGDALYFPRGFYHSACTESEHSLHVTFSVFTCTWLDLLTRAALLNAGLRESLPPGSAQNRDGTAVGLIERVQSLLEHPEAISGVARELVNEFADAHAPFPYGGFRQLTFANQVDLETRVAHRYGANARIKQLDGEVQLIFSGSGLASAREMEPVFKFVLEAATFTPRELPNVLSDDGKVQIVRELIAVGMLRVMV